MSLFYKEWNKEPVKFNPSTLILDEDDITPLKTVDTYPVIYCWELWIIRKIQDNSEGYFDFSKNIVDIGAGLGEYCWALPFKHAYAFEPNKRTIYKLHANTVLHDRVDNVDTYQCLLSDKNETVNFDGFNCEIANEYNFNINKLLQTQSCVLDSFNINNVGLIKVDVEGMEEKVLRGGLGTIIRNNYPPILFECWNVGDNGMTQEKHDSLFNFLKGLGYVIMKYWGDWETHLAVHKNQLNK